METLQRIGYGAREVMPVLRAISDEMLVLIFTNGEMCGACCVQEQRIGDMLHVQVAKKDGGMRFLGSIILHDVQHVR